MNNLDLSLYLVTNNSEDEEKFLIQKEKENVF